MDEAAILRRVLKRVVRAGRLMAEDEEEENERLFDVDDFIVDLLVVGATC